jgi:hypothetical protein
MKMGTNWPVMAILYSLNARLSYIRYLTTSLLFLNTPGAGADRLHGVF